jgi:hypothetical protein
MCGVDGNEAMPNKHPERSDCVLIGWRNVFPVQLPSALAPLKKVGCRSSSPAEQPFWLCFAKQAAPSAPRQTCGARDYLPTFCPRWVLLKLVFHWSSLVTVGLYSALKTLNGLAFFGSRWLQLKKMNKRKHLSLIAYVKQLLLSPKGWINHLLM